MINIREHLRKIDGPEFSGEWGKNQLQNFKKKNFNEFSKMKINILYENHIRYIIE